MSADGNKDLVRRFYADVINGRDVDAIDRLLAEDFRHNGESRGLASGKKVEFTSTAILRIDGDELAEAWDVVDVSLVSQLAG